MHTRTLTEAALSVLLLDKESRRRLLAHDPKALLQAVDALLAEASPETCAALRQCGLIEWAERARRATPDQLMQMAVAANVVATGLKFNGGMPGPQEE